MAMAIAIMAMLIQIKMKINKVSPEDFRARCLNKYRDCSYTRPMPRPRGL